MQLGSHIAVAVEWAGSCSSDFGLLAWEFPYAMGVALKSQKKKKKEEKEKKVWRNVMNANYISSQRFLPTGLRILALQCQQVM